MIVHDVLLHLYVRDFIAHAKILWLGSHALAQHIIICPGLVSVAASPCKTPFICPG